ncbi:hypothetical protein ACGFWD_33425 [Streptomyces sp. NPDC048448]|uniref:hypothetical protein n=1 Tax=unclassified Streptomyces TaxID=2593676 RepID=UPI00143E416B|nr:MULTISPECIES: hypothetical protein [unclassified Streptomyces]QIY66953.1 hypothetical protein HEP85_42760 [Streptomyces sp. RPA4-2]
MSYELSAVIGDAELLRGVSRTVPAARAAPLGQGLSLIPMTGALFDAVAEDGVGDEFSAVKLGRHRHGDQWIA